MESEGDWAANEAVLRTYHKVEPAHDLLEIASLIDPDPGDFADKSEDV